MSSGRSIGVSGAGQGVEADPQTKIFRHQCGGHPQPVGVKHLQPHGKSLPPSANAAPEDSTLL